MTTNPLLYKSGLPPFDSIEAKHIEPAVNQVLTEANKRFDNLESTLTDNFSPTWDNLLFQLDLIDFEIFRVWSPVGHLMGVMNSDELRKTYEKMQPEIIKFGLKTSQSRKIYRALEKLKSSSNWATLSRPRQRIV